MRFKILVISIIFSSCYLSDELPPDQSVWEYDIPANVNLHQGSLLRIDDSLKSMRFQQLQGLIIIKDDKLVYENYYKGDSRQSINNLSGASMAVTVAAIGVAVDNGLFTLDDKIQDYLPEYASFFEDDNNKTFITIRHLLANKSGISWSNGDIFEMKSADDWVQYVLSKPMQAPAGLQFNINTGSGVLLAKIIENQSNQSFQEFINLNIYQPLGISSATISQDNNANYGANDGIGLSLLDLTKLGYLMLEEGIWNGRRVLDPNFVEEATSIQTNVSGTYNAGYSWRRFGENFEDIFFVDYQDIYFITGELGQHLYIIPSKKMVIAIDAENYFFGFGNPSLNLLIEISYAIQ